MEFRKGYIEDLKSAGIEDNSVDLIVSNCVVNLSPDKEAVLRECFRVLKLGGEMYFSDVCCHFACSHEQKIRTALSQCRCMLTEG